MLDFQAARWLIAGEVPEQAGNDNPTSIPTGVFRTRDGYINIASAGDEIYRRAPVTLDMILTALEAGRPMAEPLTAHI